MPRQAGGKGLPTAPRYLSPARAAVALAVGLVGAGGLLSRSTEEMEPRVWSGYDQPLPGPKPSLRAVDTRPVDLSHVQVGQRYVFEMQNDMQTTWQVTEVGRGTVKYQAIMQMDMGEGMTTVGDPTMQEWAYVPPVGDYLTGDLPELPTRHEQVEVSGVTFDCLVVESEGSGMTSKSWATMTPGSDSVPTFPGALRVEVDGRPTLALVRIER